MTSNSDYNDPNPEFQSDRPPKEIDDSWLSIEIYVKASQPELLQGLDRWLQLDLISQAQVKKIARHHLSCTLPIKVLLEEKATPEIKEKSVVTVAQPNIFARIWQSFSDELSIRWLLFLGIFLVVISSGVLTATQWDNFPQFGQYLILLFYTFGFWGIGFWLGKQENLRLTSQTLRIIAILLIPINFWAIDRFSLGNGVIELPIVSVALITLTTISYLQFRLKKSRANKFFLPLFLLFSYLHLGWQFSLLPLLAIYAGIIAIGFIYYNFLLPQQEYSTKNLLLLISAWSLLLARVFSTSSNTNTIFNYCLAIALLGWLVATIYLTIEKTQTITSHQQAALTNTFFSNIFQITSIILLTGMWLISIVGGIARSPIFFWQTVGISIAAIHLFTQRLTLYWRKRDLTAIFFIGLQTLYISKELIPANLRSDALDLAVSVSKTEYLPESVFGVTLFPYVILFVFIATWLYRRQKPQLALYAEYLTIILGILLTCLSISNPTWRSLNLLFSTLTLGYVTKIRQPIRSSSIYLTHLLGLVTVVNAIAVILPGLSKPFWGSILAVLMAIEWGIYLRLEKPISNSIAVVFKESCWYFGLLLGAISYSFLSQIDSTPSAFRWGLVWLIAPGMLTLIAKHTRKIQQRRLVTILSCIALIVAQLLLFGQPETRFIGLAVATGLMFINAFNLRRTVVTVIHLGFGLSLIVSLLYSFIDSWNWLLVGAVTIIGLDRFRRYLQHTLNDPKFSYISQRIARGILGVGVEAKNFKLINKYIKAANYWAIALITLEIAVLSIIYFNLSKFNDQAQYLLSIVLIVGAIIWRYRRHPNNLALYALVWLVELLTIGVVTLLGGNGLAYAITNIILGLLALGLVRQLKFPWTQLHLSYIPLFYAGLGILWRLSYFNSYTGLLTLGAATILINTKQDKRHPALINYLAFTGITLGIYELAIYQMYFASGNSAADALTIFSLIAAAIAFTYRLGAWWYRQRHRKTIFNLSLSKVIAIAHLHWLISSILKIAAASIAIQGTNPRLTPVSIATSFCLGAYALIQGRDSTDADTSNTANWWVYVGLGEIAATLVYSRLIIDRLSLFDPWRIVFTCAVALLIYQIPWRNFGWQVIPWQRTALITPALIAMVTAEDISYFSLLVTAVFYLRIAYKQENIRWSYISLGFVNYGIIRLGQSYGEFVWVAGIIGLSILYIAQIDPYFQSRRQPRHYLRIVGSSIICLAAFYQSGIVSSAIGFGLILIGLGLKIRAFLFVGTLTLILTAIYQLIILVMTYSFLKWVVGLLAGVCSIIIAAGFEKQRERALIQLRNYENKLQDWQ